MSNKIPSTPVNRLLKSRGVAFTEHPYAYVDHGGTRVSG